MALVCPVLGGHLRLRSTFIDMDEAARGPDTCAARGLARAKSSPPVLRRAADGELGADVFVEELAYVASLSERLASLWESASPDGSPEGSVGATAARVFFERGPSKAATDSPSPSNAEPMGEKAGEPTVELPDVMLGPSTWEAPCLDSLGIRFDSMETVSGRASEAAESVAASTMEGGSQGSLGHPHLCSRPCLYFASGQCANGSACEFCHHPHSRRPAHLDKKYREALLAMSSARAKALVFPVLREKVRAFDASVQTAVALEDLARACGEAAAVRSAATWSRSDRNITDALAATTLRVVLTALQRTALRGEPSAQTAAESFMKHLRSNASPTPTV